MPVTVTVFTRVGLAADQRMSAILVRTICRTLRTGRKYVDMPGKKQLPLSSGGCSVPLRFPGLGERCIFSSLGSYVDPYFVAPRSQ